MVLESSKRLRTQLLNNSAMSLLRVTKEMNQDAGKIPAPLCSGQHHSQYLRSRNLSSGHVEEWILKK